MIKKRDGKNEEVKGASRERKGKKKRKRKNGLGKRRQKDSMVTEKESGAYPKWSKGRRQQGHKETDSINTNGDTTTKMHPMKPQHLFLYNLHNNFNVHPFFKYFYFSS